MGAQYNHKIANRLTHRIYGFDGFITGSPAFCPATPVGGHRQLVTGGQRHGEIRTYEQII